MNGNGKRSYVSEKYVRTAQSTLTGIVEDNPRRIALWMTDTTNSGLWATKTSTLLDTVGAGNAGIPNSFMGQEKISRALHGALAQCAWMYYNAAGVDVVTVVEVLEE